MSILSEQAKRYAEIHQRLMRPRPPSKPRWYQPKVKLVEKLFWNTPQVCEIIQNFEPLDVVPSHKSRVMHIAKEICQNYQITLTELRCKGRQQALVKARQHFYYLAAKDTIASLPHIGRQCGGRDHTTVLYGIAKFAVDNDLPLPRKMKPTCFKRLQKHRRQAA